MLTRKFAINYLKSSGFSDQQIARIIEALTDAQDEKIHNCTTCKHLGKPIYEHPCFTCGMTIWSNWEKVSDEADT